MQTDQIDEFFRRLHAKNPQPKTELEYDNDYTLLVAVILSAQATDKSVNKVTCGLFAQVQTPQEMGELGLATLMAQIKTIGLYKSKANNIIATSKILVDFYGGKIPRTREELENLPGVGRKTANVILNVALGLPTIAVDTHLFRLSNRIGLAPGKTLLAVEQQLQAVIPKKWQYYAHHWLILHGRYICVARRPKCELCGVTDLCDFYQEKFK